MKGSGIEGVWENPGELRESMVTKESVAHEKKWMGIAYYDYSIGDKVFHNYEVAYRPTRKDTGLPIDGVEIVPIIKKKGEVPQIVIIANFRPAAGHFSLEFPAGLVESEDFEANALRELEEETGYVAERIVKLPLTEVHCDPWKSNEGGMLYLGLINADDPNHKKKQDLDESENIRVLHFPLDKNLPETLSKEMREKGYVIHSKVWSFCVGFNLDLLLPCK